MPSTFATHAGRRRARRAGERIQWFALVLTTVTLGLFVAGTSGAVPPVSFAPQASYGTGAHPHAVVVGDFNGDGKLDLVTPNYAGGTVGVLLGHGDGTFGASIATPTYGPPWRVAVGDFNRDGKLDVAVCGRYTTKVEVLLGHGDGTFGAYTLYEVEAEPHVVAVADLDGDGKLDLAVSNMNSASVSVLLGHGDGTFASATSVPVGPLPQSVAIADVNGDGHPDLFTANFIGNIISIMLGHGDGTFDAPTALIVDANPACVELDDLDGDGKLDLVTTGYYASTLVVLMGHGDGTFAPKVSYASTNSSAMVAIADYNGDGNPDLAAAGGAPSNVSLLLGYGDGTFAPATCFGSGADFSYIASGDFNGDSKPDLAAPSFYSNEMMVWINTTVGNLVAPQPPATCIAPVHPCVAVPVTIARADATPLRGYSVDVQLSGDLALCAPEIVEGTYLSGIGTTFYNVVDNGGGSYTVDGTILGLPCGATAPSGTLFTLNLGSSAASGTGTVTVMSVTLRDCDNAVVAGYAGPPASVTIDNEVPTAVVLAAVQKQSGNDGDGTTQINLSWGGTVTAGDSVLIYRAGWGNYPEYDDVGGGVPATPSYPPGSPWALAGAVVGASAYADETTARDFWYYVAFVKDPCGNVGPVSNRTGGTLNYHLGDVHNGSAVACVGDNAVDLSDISFLGAHYGVPVLPGFDCLDVGPTTDNSVNARPTTDNKVGFEDLMMFAINYGLVSAPQNAMMPVAAASDELSLDGPAQVTAGMTFTVSLRLKGAGDLQGLSAQLGWDRAVVEPVSVEAGGLATTQNAVVFSSGAGNVDAALLGANRGFMGEGVLATVTFRALANGATAVTLAKLDARNLGNQPVTLAGVKAATVTATQFAPAMPNPFRGTTTLSYALAKGGAVELAVYGVDGRKVATLASGVQEAGSYRLSWDGAGARPGLYYARLTTPEGRLTRTLVLTR
jgi:hypothetical protein